MSESAGLVEGAFYAEADGAWYRLEGGYARGGPVTNFIRCDEAESK